MARHSIARATPRSDFTVAIERSDGSKSVIKGEALSYLREPAVFLHRLFVQSEGQSLAWETPSGLIDFHVDELWQRAYSKFAAE
jgi:hypothetical protein